MAGNSQFLTARYENCENQKDGKTTIASFRTCQIKFLPIIRFPFCPAYMRTAVMLTP